MAVIGYAIISLASILATNNAKCKWKTAVHHTLLVTGCAMVWIV